MPLCNRYSLCMATALVVWLPNLSAQSRTEDPPKELPAQRLTQAEKTRRQALALYAKGLQCERNNLFLEATRTYEEAIQLDPDAVPPRRSLVPLYLALDRLDDALKTCRKILDLDPDDYETWYLYSRQLKDQGKTKEAREALARAAASPRIKDHSDQLAQICFDLAMMHEEAKEFDKALDAYRRVVQILDHPDAVIELGNVSQEDLDAKSAETYERIGRLALQLKRFDAAVDAFKKAQKKEPVRANRLNLNLAKVCQTQEKPDEALRHLDAYLKTQPPGSEGYELKINLLAQLGRQNEILSMLRQAAKADNHNVPLQLLFARQCAERDQPAEALVIYAQLAKDTPTAEVYGGLFRLYRRQGRMAEALREFDASILAAHPHPEGKVKKEGSSEAAARARAMVQALRDDPDLTKAILPEAARKLQYRQNLEYGTQVFLAVLAKRVGCLDDAEKLFYACLATVAPNQDNEQLVYLGLLEILWKARKYQAVVDVCEKGLAHADRSNREMFHRYLSQAWIILGNADKAVEQADLWAKIATEDSRLPALLNRVDILRHLDRNEEAVAQCQALFKEFHLPGQIRDIRYELSNVYTGMRAHAKAEEQLQLILKDDPSDVTVCNDLGYLWADQGKNLTQAEELIRKALKLDRDQRKTGTDVGSDDDQDHAAYVDSLGWVLFRRGQLEAAREQLQRATVLQPGGDDPVIWDHLGDVYFRLEQLDKAKKAWHKALGLYETEKRRKLDDQYKELKNKLKLLDTDN